MQLVKHDAIVPRFSKNGEESLQESRRKRIHVTPMTFKFLPLARSKQERGRVGGRKGGKVGLTTIETTRLIGAEKGGLEKQRSDWPRL